MIQEVNAAQFRYILDRRPLPVGAGHPDIYACATIHHVLTDIYACAIIPTPSASGGQTNGRRRTEKRQTIAVTLRIRFAARVNETTESMYGRS